MVDDLRIATLNLYDIFSIYPLEKEIIGCPCCVKGGDKNILHIKKLNELSLDDLTIYYFKAITTLGDVSDFKHFLPRLFDLLANDLDTIDVFIIFEKLEYAKWTEWSKDEQQAIKSFLILWWKYSLRSTITFQGENILYFKDALGDIQPLLDNWSMDLVDDTFKNLISYIFDTFQFYKIEKDIDRKSYQKLLNWLIKKNDIIETGFFFYEQKQPDFAQTISFCYDIVKRLPNS